MFDSHAIHAMGFRRLRVHVFPAAHRTGEAHRNARILRENCTCGRDKHNVTNTLQYMAASKSHILAVRWSVPRAHCTESHDPGNFVCVLAILEQLFEIFFDTKRERVFKLCREGVRDQNVPDSKALGQRRDES